MKAFAAIAGGVVILTLAFCCVAGVFDAVEVVKGTVVPFHAVYRDRSGPYEGMRYAVADVRRYLRDEKGIMTTCGVGIFRDSAAKKGAGRVSGIGGCVVGAFVLWYRSRYLQYSACHEIH